MRRNQTRAAAQGMSPERRNEMIAVAAYYRAERRGFAESDPVSDWLAAESEIDQLLHTGMERPRADTAHEFLHRLEMQVGEWDRRFDELKAEAKSLKAKARTEYNNDLKALQARRAALGETLHDLGKRSGDAFDELRQGAERAWTELREAMEQLAGRFR